MKVEESVEALQTRIVRVLRDCPEGMDEYSLKAACAMDKKIEQLQAGIRLLQQGALIGHIDARGKVHLEATSSPQQPKYYLRNGH